jgi:hypothetical protein
MAYVNWTAAEEALVRELYGKMTYRQMEKEHLPRHKADHIRSKAKAIGISKARVCKQGPHENNKVPMEKALTPAQADKMRTFLRTLVHYSNYGKVDVTKFMRAWRENECGYVYGDNKGKRVAVGG